MSALPFPLSSLTSSAQNHYKVEEPDSRKEGIQTQPKLEPKPSFQNNFSYFYVFSTEDAKPSSFSQYNFQSNINENSHFS